MIGALGRYLYEVNMWHKMAKARRTQSSQKSKGVVYLLTNPAMPGLVKIGKTTSAAQVRMDSLYTTGVPVPFTCVFAVEVSDITATEKALHIAFGPNRINPRREFFKIDEIQARVLLEQLGTKDVTPRVEADNQKVDDDSRRAGEKLSARRPNLNFDKMGIPSKSILKAVNSNHTAIVVDARAVEFEGQVMSLTAATRVILNVDYGVQPSPHWQFEGEVLKDIYERTYGDHG